MTDRHVSDVRSMLEMSYIGKLKCDQHLKKPDRSIKPDGRLFVFGNSMLFLGMVVDWKRYVL